MNKLLGGRLQAARIKRMEKQSKKLQGRIDTLVATLQKVQAETADYPSLLATSADSCLPESLKQDISAVLQGGAL